MNKHESTAAATDTSIDHDAAAGLSDDDYMSADSIPAAASAAFDPKAAAGLSDDDYLRDSTTGSGS